MVRASADDEWPKLGCSRCGRTNEKPLTAGSPAELALQRARGCIPGEPATAFFGWPGEGIKTRQCPWAAALEDDGFVDLIMEWRMIWRATGALPYPGTMSDQPAWVVEALTAVETTLSLVPERKPDG